ncbi:MAG: hypothetical protein SFT90_07265 [Rickettsiales bacterium]|nr:hypothetical protein [Rickettsiales bacterium]
MKKLLFTLLILISFGLSEGANSQGIIADKNFMNLNDNQVNKENNCNILFEKLNRYNCQTFLDRPFIYINSSDAENLMCMRLFEIYLINNCDRSVRRIINKQKTEDLEKTNQKVVTEKNKDTIEEVTPDGTICGKEKFSDLIGKNQSEIMVNKIEEPFRIICKDCPVTMDFAPNRVNFYLDEKENVKSIDCG